MQASEKDTLLKLLPRRFVPDSELVGIGGNDYETTFIPREPQDVYQIVSGNLTSLSFSYDSNTGTTTITTVSAPNENIFADYPLYFSTRETRYLADDPVNETGGLKEWEPRLAGNFSVGQESKDLLQGVLVVSSSAARIVNEDFELNQYLTNYDNYFNAAFAAYAVIGDTIYKLSNGVIASFVAGKNITFRFKSQNKLYDQTATLGNARKYYKTTTADYPSLESRWEGKPITNEFGFTQIAPATDGRDSLNVPIIDASTFEQARYIGNSTWLLGVCRNRIPQNVTAACSEVGRFVDGDGDNVTQIQVSINNSKWFFAGIDLSGKYNTGVIFAGFDVKSVDYTTGRIIVKGQPVGVTFAQLYLGPAYIWINDSGPSSAIVKMPFSEGIGFPDEFFEETTTNGETLIYYRARTPSPNFTSEQADIRFFLLNLDSRIQTGMAQDLIESVGLSINASEFSTAQTEANNSMKMSIPINGERSLGTVGSYLQVIANSNNGLFYINDQTEEVGYKIINENLSGVDWEVSSVEILEPELIPTVEYQDTFAEISITNPTYYLNDYLSGISYSAESDFSRVFNQRERIYQENNYNENVSAAGAERLDRAKQPAYFYNFSLKTDDYFVMQIGEIVKIKDVGNKLISNQNEVDVIIVSIKKSSELVEVTGYEFSRIS